MQAQGKLNRITGDGIHEAGQEQAARQGSMSFLEPEVGVRMLRRHCGLAAQLAAILQGLYCHDDVSGRRARHERRLLPALMRRHRRVPIFVRHQQRIVRSADIVPHSQVYVWLSHDPLELAEAFELQGELHKDLHSGGHFLGEERLQHNPWHF